MMMLALKFLAASVEVDNNAVLVGLVVVALATIANLALALKQLFVRTPPIESEFATKDELAAHAALNKSEHDNIFSKLGGVDRGWRDRMGDIAAKVSALDERTATMNSQITIMAQDVKDLLRRAKEIRS